VLADLGEASKGARAVGFGLRAWSFMIAAMTTRIVFSEGASVTVTDEAHDVRHRLAEDKRRGAPFTEFQEQGGRVVFVAPDRVAFVQWISDQS
jgi:hypothetical protein